jgi:hypothetical protein
LTWTAPEVGALPKALLSIAAALAVSLLAPAFLSVRASAEERILSYNSDITVNADSSADVTETIHLRRDNYAANGGLTRILTTHYKDRFGNPCVSDYRVLFVSRDGKPEDYTDQHLADAVYINIGDQNKTVTAGEHTYSITFRVTNAVNMFKDHDELYSCAVSYGWNDYVDSASAVVTLPTGIPAQSVTYEAFTGREGEKGHDYTASKDTQGRLNIKTTRALSPGEGFVVLVTFPKGYITPSPASAPTPTEGSSGFMETLIAVIGSLIIFSILAVVYYFARRSDAPQR